MKISKIFQIVSDRTASHVFRLISPVLGLEYEFRGMENLRKNYTCVIGKVQFNMLTKIKNLTIFKNLNFVNKN